MTPCTQCPREFISLKALNAHRKIHRSDYQHHSKSWTSAEPRAGGWYWHWNGNADDAPVPTSVMWSGSSGKHFVSMGQLGITEAIDCDQYGGWWLLMKEPSLPRYAA